MRSRRRSPLRSIGWALCAALALALLASLPLYRPESSVRFFLGWGLGAAVLCGMLTGLLIRRLPAAAAVGAMAGSLVLGGYFSYVEHRWENMPLYFGILSALGVLLFFCSIPALAFAVARSDPR